MLQQILMIWSLVPLPFLNPACASGSSWFTYCWSLAWGILSITLLGCEMSTIVVWYWIFIRIVCNMHLLSAELLHSAYTFSSVQFSRSVMSDSLRPHESQHARPPCPSPAPGVHRDSHPSSQWCHPAISSSVVPFSSRPQSLPASEFFPMSQLFT